MKKIWGILIVGLLWSNVGFAKCIKGDCNNGYGTSMWTDGTKYVGKHKDGKWHGQGTWTYPSGDKYVGEYKDGKRHGQGTYTHADGTVGKGIWEDGELVKPN